MALYKEDIWLDKSVQDHIVAIERLKQEFDDCIKRLPEIQNDLREAGKELVELAEARHSILYGELVHTPYAQYDLAQVRLMSDKAVAVPNIVFAKAVKPRAKRGMIKGSVRWTREQNRLNKQAL